MADRGGALSLFWNRIRRRRESDLASRESFYAAYAEFFTTWKLWNSHKRHDVAAPPDVQWQLLSKAEEAEAAFEALLVKVTSEKKLDDVACERLAGFRRGYQPLRESTRANEGSSGGQLRNFTTEAVTPSTARSRFLRVTSRPC